MPAVLFYGIYDLYKRWLSCMRITLVPMIVMVVSTFAHLIFCYILVEVYDEGILGLGYASLLSNFVKMIIVMIYCRCSSQINIALAPVNIDAFRGYCEYLRYSLPSTVMMCSEMWAS